MTTTTEQEHTEEQHYEDAEVREWSAAHQEPRLRLLGHDYEASHGSIAIAFAAAHGLYLDPWQQTVVTDALAIDLETRGWAFRTFGCSVPRQNGKGGAIECIELYCSAVIGEKIIHTSHQVKTTQVAFERLVSYFTSPEYPDLFQLVKKIVRQPGAERIMLRNGGEIRFISRESNSGRGFTVDRIVFDEAMEIKDSSISSLVPTAASGKMKNSSFTYFGTPPGPQHNGEPFRRIREAAFKKDYGTAWLEWSAEQEGLNVSDWRTWAEANPAIASGRYQVDLISAAYTNMDEETFTREVLGVWGTVVSESIVDSVSWSRIADERSQIATNRVLAVDISPDRAFASVCVAGVRADGRTHMELVNTKPGTGWVVPWVVELLRNREPGWFDGLVIDNGGPAANLIDEFRLSGIRATPLDVKDIVLASQHFYDSVMSEKVRHIEQIQLTNALAVSRKRKVGERGWAISRASQDSNITPIVAAVLALYGASVKRRLYPPVPKPKEEKEKPQRRGMVLF